jgi:hypothetical protein
MPNKKLKTAFKIILGGFIMMAFAIGCNDTSSKTETKADSTVTTDTMKMDTAHTKPIVLPPNRTDTTKSQ